MTEVDLVDPAEPLAPWNSEHVLRLLFADGLGILLAVVGAVQSHRQDVTSDQLTWLYVAVWGLLLAGCAHTTWLLRGRQNLSRAQLEIAALARILHPAPTQDIETVSTSSLVSGAGMTRYHRSDCPLVAGKAVRTAGRSRFEQSGLNPCTTCEP